MILQMKLNQVKSIKVIIYIITISQKNFSYLKVNIFILLMSFYLHEFKNKGTPRDSSLNLPRTMEDKLNQ